MNTLGFDQLLENRFERLLTKLPLSTTIQHHTDTVRKRLLRRDTACYDNNLTFESQKHFKVFIFLLTMYV